MSEKKPLNIVIYHHFDYPYGMATTKRYQFFIDYLKDRVSNIHIVLKQHDCNQENSLIITNNFYLGVKYFKVFPTQKRKYPFYWDRKQYKIIMALVDQIWQAGAKNIVLTGGITPDTFPVIRSLYKRGWLIFFDFVEDYTLLHTLFTTKTEIAYAPLQMRLLANFLRYYYRYLENKMFSYASGISAISHTLFEKAEKKQRNTRLIPIMAQHRVIFSKQRFGHPIVLFFAGTGSLKDGLVTLAKAYAILAGKHDIRLKICGKLTATGQKQIIENCPGAHVSFLGYLSDEDYYQELALGDILLMTRNNSEFSNAGFPFKLGEYLASGNPVVSTRVGDIEKYLIDERDCILVNPDDVDDLVRAVEYLINDDTNAFEIGRNGYEAFKKYFYCETNSKKLYDLMVT